MMIILVVFVVVMEMRVIMIISMMMISHAVYTCINYSTPDDGRGVSDDVPKIRSS